MCICDRGKCGTYCAECKFKGQFNCKGCKESNGVLFWGKCEVFNCCSNNGVAHCGMCIDFPCDTLKAFVERGHNPHRLENLKKWKAEGIDSF